MGTSALIDAVNAGRSVGRRRFKPYPAYKDSGVEWLGTIPAHWEVKRLKFVVALNPPASEVRSLAPDTEVSFVPMEAVGEYGGLDLTRTKQLADVGNGYTYFRDGDVVVAKITPCFENGEGARAAGLMNGIGFGTTELHVLRSGPGLDEQFLFYLTLSRAFRGLGEAEMYRAGGQKRVPESFVENLRHPVPPLPEQRAIAAFLDRETTRIDALMAKKERLIELLQEKHTALITHAVTNGLDPSVPMKDSGVEWLGEIPAHWEVKRVKNLSRFVTSGSRGWAEHYTDEGALFLRIGNLRAASIDLDLLDVQHVTPPPGAEGERTRVRAGDLLVSITALIGAVGVVPPQTPAAFVNQHLALVRVSDRSSLPRWLAYCVLSRVGQEQLRVDLYGGTKDGLSLDDIRSLAVLVPPKDEQERVIDILDSAERQVDALVAKVREAIDHLKELRTALISAAVTGKIDVREEVA